MPRLKLFGSSCMGRTQYGRPQGGGTHPSALLYKKADGFRAARVRWLGARGIVPSSADQQRLLRLHRCQGHRSEIEVELRTNELIA